MAETVKLAGDERSRGAVGLCREAAIQNGPGLQPWVLRSAKFGLKVAAEVSS